MATEFLLPLGPSTSKVSCDKEPSFRVLGVRVDAVQIPGVVQKMENWIEQRDGCRFITVTGMHGVMEAQHNPEFKKILSAAALVVPDGMPLVWIGRGKRFALWRRVYGPELMATFFAQTAKKNYRHFFYGGAPGVAEDLAERITQRFPGAKIAGKYCPPFRALTSEESQEVVDIINRSKADIVWVGLSTPKQERWMFEHCNRLNVPVLIGVGAAFDFHTGRAAQAPEWMRENGLEWFFRLSHEPRRLWRRYLIYGSQFLFLNALELLGLKKFS
jgi:N-acetylglucosaminyldiphosphoundecaprenol N-acetyl-beta-D-mannosaminyltransferase